MDYYFVDFLKRSATGELTRYYIRQDGERVLYKRESKAIEAANSVFEGDEKIKMVEVFKTGAPAPVFRLDR